MRSVQTETCNSISTQKAMLEKIQLSTFAKWLKYKIKSSNEANLFRTEARLVLIFIVTSRSEIKYAFIYASDCRDSRKRVLSTVTECYSPTSF